jgi:steroid delta-isomerase-like uncharacterized protein
MSEQENVAIMRRWFQEVWNEGRTETVTELLAPNAIGIGQAEHDSIIRDPKDFLVLMANLRGAFPDIHINVDDAFGSGDKVIVRWTMRGTHTGGHLGIARSGKEVSVTGMSLVRISGGKLVEGWDNWDQLKLMQTIGAIEVPKARLLRATK